MANYLVTDTDLTSVANAIRTRGGTSASLTFPTGFSDAIAAIPSGDAVWHEVTLTQNYDNPSDICKAIFVAQATPVQAYFRVKSTTVLPTQRLIANGTGFFSSSSVYGYGTRISGVTNTTITLSSSTAGSANANSGDVYEYTFLNEINDDHVPYSADHSVLNAYKTANNYPDPTVYTYEEY